MENVETMSPEWKTCHVRESHYFLQVVKCSDRRCCSEPRSAYFQVINRFIPAPMCIEEGAQLTDSTDKKFCSLFLRMALKDEQFKVGIVNEVPFDHCCLSLKDILIGRTCEWCGIYHGTKKSLTKHLPKCSHKLRNRNKSLEESSNMLVSEKRKTVVISSRPKRLAAVRQREKMVVWSSKLNAEHVDWFDEDYGSDNEVDVQPLNVVEVEKEKDDQFPVFELDSVMRNEWENE